MARAATTTDVFNAIAEPRRRQIIDLLSHQGPGGGLALAAGWGTGTEQSVGAMVRTLGLRQPTVSKHLAVLRKVGVVSMSKHGQQRMYRLNPQVLMPVHDWVKTYERLWENQLMRIKERAESNLAPDIE